MKTKITLITLLFVVSSFVAQNLKINWSERIIYDNNLDGFFNEYVGANDRFIYAKFNNLTAYPEKGDKKIKLLAFDKASMKKVGELRLKGFKDVQNENDYYKTIVLSNIIYVVWTKKEEGGNYGVYIQSLDNKLQKLQDIRKIYELQEKSELENMSLLSNTRANNQIVFIQEFPITRDKENLKIEYKVLNSDLSIANSGQISLPLQVSKKKGLFSSSTGLNCDYEFGDDGNIYLQDLIKMNNEDKKQFKKGETSVYPYFAQINPETGQLKDYHIKFNSKNTFQFSSIITKNSIKLYGFFSDLKKDETGNRTHGIFYISLDNSSFKVNESQFSYFDKPFLDELYASDKENQKSMDNNYVVEQTIADGSDLVLFCSIMENYAVTKYKDGGEVTNYYCEKRNVTLFKLNKSGEILWARNIDREIVYDRYTVYDLKAVKKDDGYFVSYGSMNQLTENKLLVTTKRRGVQLTNRLEYATVKSRTGEYQKGEYSLNPLNTKRKNYKYVDQTNLALYDNKLYTNCAPRNFKLKPLSYISCLCPPVFAIFYSNNGGWRKGYGQLGAFEPLQ